MPGPEAVNVHITLDTDDVFQAALAAVVATVRKYADQEAGPVRERLVQIADAMEEEAKDGL